MNVSLTPLLEEQVRERVAGGLYTSSSEVVREALRLLFERDKLRQARLEELRADLRTGLDQLERGEGIPADEVLRRLRDQAAKRRAEQAEKP